MGGLLRRIVELQGIPLTLGNTVLRDTLRLKDASKQPYPPQAAGKERTTTTAATATSPLELSYNPPKPRQRWGGSTKQKKPKKNPRGPISRRRLEDDA